VSIVFNKPSNPFDYIEKGLRDPERVVMTHDSIIERLIDYFEKVGHTNQHYLHYLCFIASIADLYKPESVLMYYQVLLKLLKNPDLIQRYNKQMI
jgi:hypothetical protein